MIPSSPGDLFDLSNLITFILCISSKDTAFSQNAFSSSVNLTSTVLKSDSASISSIPSEVKSSLKTLFVLLK